MIPIRDSNPTGSVPVVTIGLILINSLVWLHQVSLGPDMGRFVFEYGLTPVRFVLADRIQGGFMVNAAIPLMTSMFMHGGWLHVIGNMWFLWIFGDNVEDRLGHIRYLAFYLLCGIGASLAHVYFNPESRIPTVGASGAISGVLGAYLVTFPNARVLTLFIFIIIVRLIEVPAYIFLVVWLIFQFVSGASALGSYGDTGGVAYWAHMGGFVIGLALILVFPKSRRFRDLSVLPDNRVRREYRW